MPSAIPQERWNEMKKFADRLLTRGKEHDTAKSKKRQAKECGKIGIVAWSADRLEGNDHSPSLIPRKFKDLHFHLQ